MMHPITGYSNYRDYLRDILDYQKTENPELSHRNILKKMGITSTGFLSNVLSGKKNLTHIQIRKLAKILKLNREDFNYFETLVYFNQSKTLEDKNEYFQQMLNKSKDNTQILNEEQFRLFSKWYYVAIREILYFYKFKGNYEELAKKLNPPIRPQEAEQAILDLEKMRLITKSRDRTYKQTNVTLSSGDEVISNLHLLNYHSSVIQLAKEALEKIPSSERDISAVTLTLSQQGFKKLRQEIQRFRKKAVKIAEEDTKANKVYQFNSQFFPISGEDS